MAEGKMTIDHDEIREWAEARGGRAARVRHTGGGEDPGVIRIAFPDAPHARDDKLEEITWDEFFEKFDEAGLALVYQEETADGRRSNFNKLIGRETADARAHGESHTSRHGDGRR
ncbi:MAG: hypothetical protein ACM3JG_12525 [Thiohalocapsa sp.]